MRPYLALTCLALSTLAACGGTTEHAGTEHASSTTTAATDATAATVATADEPTTGGSSAAATTDPATSVTTGAPGTSGEAGTSGEPGTTGDAVGPGCAEHVTFATINATILTGCGGYIGCHLKGPYGGELDLTPDHAYAGLVGVASSLVPAELRVSPGDSAHSLLYKKLINDLAPDESEGKPMPKTATQMMWAPLTQEQTELVRCWIDEGAPND